MTLDEFFERLPRDGWELKPYDNRQKAIRCNGACPIRVVAGVDGAGGFRHEAQVLQLENAFAIACAADGDEGCDPLLRARLLTHCNLKEA